MFSVMKAGLKIHLEETCCCSVRWLWISYYWMQLITAYKMNPRHNFCY